MGRPRVNFKDPNAHELIMRAAGADSSYLWTRPLTGVALANTDVDGLAARVAAHLDRNHITYPDQETLVRRCVTGLLVGHLILQGPPGTGKTTLARALADAFEVHLFPSTATSEWSPFHVVGGLRPRKDGGLDSALGVVPQAVLDCAERVRAAEGESPSGDEDGLGATWLLIDEFNRADIDKAIGSLYTLLSSCEPSHLDQTPIDLWFEDGPADRSLWVPARFRILGTMNDLDTSYVSTMSQGLRRRFQFITVGVPSEGATTGSPIAEELTTALAGARASLAETYGVSVGESDDLTSGLGRLQRLVDGLRRPTNNDGWPVGTAQVVDVLKSYLLIGPHHEYALDESVAQRLVGQMTMLSQGQYDTFKTLLQGELLTLSVRELEHVYRPYAVM